MKTASFFASILMFMSSYSALGSTLLMNTTPTDVQNLVTDQSLINVSEAREVCRQLTDDDFISHKGFPVPKRSKGVKRHVKHLCERVDMLIWQESTVLTEDMSALYELRLLQTSLLQKGKADAIGMTLRGKLSMGLYSVLTPFTLKFKNRIGKNEAGNLELTKPVSEYTVDELALLNPKNSPFFELNTNKEMHKRFGDLAKKKKIDEREKMVIVFDSVSDNGSAPKIKAIDSLNDEDEWSLKWGDEIHTDVVGSRLFAALGFDVDHPYYRTRDDLYVVFPQENLDKNADDMLNRIRQNFSIDISNFVSKVGIVSDEDIANNPELKNYKGLPYVTFIECAIEGRPDRVKRMGSIVPDHIGNADRRELRGALLAHMWIDNWDVREENTLISVNHLGKYKYETRGAFSDLGTSLGVKLTLHKGDFRVGLPNQFGWNLVKRDSDKSISFHGVMNSRMAPYKNATYADLKWMAHQIARIDKTALEKILEKSGWPKDIQKIYFHKLASRREQILTGFDITDPNPIKFETTLNFEHNGEVVVKDGRLIKDIDADKHPIGFRNTRGRVRNYGRSL